MANLHAFYDHYQTEYWSFDHPDSDYLIKRPTYDGSSGYGDLLSLHNGIVLGRNSIASSQSLVEPAAPFSCDVGMHLIVDANYTLHASNLRTDTSIHSQQIWRRSGDFGDINSIVDTEYLQNSPINSHIVTIDFNQTLLSRWAESFAVPTWLLPSNNQDPEMVQVSLSNQPRLLARAAYILSLPCCTLSDRLALESQALLLCQDILGIQDISGRLANQKSQIDQAVDIIRQEYSNKLTISLLAQRVGINECYLKQQFKQQTGKTIGSFIRELRMQEAMRLLLDEYKSVQETAWYVGYRDPSNFSKAFAKFYGVTPTQLI
ncbi:MULTISPECIES: helix-turn-helix domain-containing protein [Psychrobacter]|jgi:AraC-like DNA-binding protein|uniref:helix-turn-helix domain-containing protein n=1 Tax=Psychrobacter TaxID=497 RepID=UPI0018DF388C|nr:MULTISPECIES: AraC family transcriptional regulator [Psychrobacter]MCG3808091.1 AraC family transcriptional regulator [Psychrobacter sp. Ps4]